MHLVQVYTIPGEPCIEKLILWWVGTYSMYYISLEPMHIQSNTHSTSIEQQKFVLRMCSIADYTESIM